MISVPRVPPKMVWALVQLTFGRWRRPMVEWGGAIKVPCRASLSWSKLGRSGGRRVRLWDHLFFFPVDRPTNSSSVPRSALSDSGVVLIFSARLPLAPPPQQRETEGRAPQRVHPHPCSTLLCAICSTLPVWINFHFSSSYWNVCSCSFIWGHEDVYKWGEDEHVPWRIWPRRERTAIWGWRGRYIVPRPKWSKSIVFTHGGKRPSKTPAGIGCSGCTIPREEHLTPFGTLLGV